MTEAETGRHPETDWRMGQIAGSFGEHGAAGVSLAWDDVRNMLDGVSGRGLSCFAGLAADGPFEVDPGDGKGTFRLEAEDGKIALFRIHTPSRSKARVKSEVAKAIVLPTFVRGHAMWSVDRFVDFMAFADAVRGMPGVTAGENGRALGTPDVDEAFDDDGGFPGEATRALVEAHLDAVMVGALEQVAGSIPGIHATLSGLGLTWGKAYASYNDMDIHAAALDLPGGRPGLFHMNDDVVHDQNAYLIALDGGAVVVWMVDPREVNLAKTVASFPDGKPPAGVSAYRLDLATRELDKPTRFDLSHVPTVVGFGVDADVGLAKGLSEGPDDFPWEDSTKFSRLERGNDPDEDLDDDDEDADAPAPRA